MRNRVEPNNSSQTLFSFKGNMSDNLYDGILELAEYKLQQESTTKSTRKKVFKVLIETLQNVYHHLDDLPPNHGEYSVAFSLKKDNFTYTVSAGNHIHKTKVSSLRSYIDRVNAMSQSELKAFYLQRLSQGQLTNDGGAGLGFVDIIRKSKEKITYNFKPVNKDYSYFSLQVKVSA
jgi:hypothetical protein